LANLAVRVRVGVRARVRVGVRARVRVRVRAGLGGGRRLADLAAANAASPAARKRLDLPRVRVGIRVRVGWE